MNRFDDWTGVICHDGQLGMKWGIRRYQNYDGSLTPEGRRRYLKNPDGTNDELNRKGQKQLAKLLKSRNKDKNAAGEALIKAMSMKGKDPQIEQDLYADRNKKQRAVINAGFKTSIKKQARSMSQEELKTAISRLELEKKYTDLIKQQNSGTMAVGREVAGDIIKNTIKNLGTQTVTYAAGTLINKLAKKDIVNPKKGQKDK